MAQPASLALARQLVRVIPFTSQKTFTPTNNGNLGAGATFIAAFDVGLASTDRNQLIGGAAGAPPSADPTQFAIGANVDVLAFSATQAGTIEVDFAVDSSASYRAMPLVAVPVATLVNISFLRVTGRYVRVIFTNIGGAPSAVELGIYVRSQ